MSRRSEHTPTGTSKSAGTYDTSKPPPLPAELWAGILNHNHSHLPSNALRYSDLLQLSTIDRCFLEEVSPLVPCIKVTDAAQMNNIIARKRYSGIRQVIVDCMFCYDQPQAIFTKALDREGVEEQQNLEPATANAFAFARIVPFLSKSFPQLEVVTLGGRTISKGKKNNDGKDWPFRSFHDVGNCTKKHPILDLQTQLVEDICNAYEVGAFSQKVSFLRLLEKSVCPIRRSNGGIVIRGTIPAEGCIYCTQIVKACPPRDVKEELLNNYEESLFDGALCLSSRKVIEIMAERDPGYLKHDVDFFCQCMSKGRQSILQTVVDMDLMPNISALHFDKIHAAIEESEDRKLPLPKSLRCYLEKEGLPIQEIDLET